MRFEVAGGISVHRACLLLSLADATFRYVAHPNDDSAFIEQVHELATRYPRYGYHRIIALMRQAQTVNHKPVRRVWRQERLQVKRLRRSRGYRSRPKRVEATYPGHIWAYDFVEDALHTDASFKVLTVMDEFTKLWDCFGCRRHDISRARNWCVDHTVCSPWCPYLYTK